MARARFHKTLFIPALEGQYKLWSGEVLSIVNKVDEIIQLGNIIGCNELVKDSPERGANNALLNYIGKERSAHSNWTQIVGPNEILALNFPDEWTNLASNRILRKRWLTDRDDKFIVASVNRNRLVTHGGLTYGLWRELGKPSSPQKTAALLNEKYSGTLYQGPCFKLGNPSNFSANPIFADPLRELYPSWITTDEVMPFGQVHGSLGLNSTTGANAIHSPYSSLEFIDKVRYISFGSHITIKDRTFFNVAPELSNSKLIKTVPQPWRFYIEKTPVLDFRKELFKEEDKTEN